METTATPLTEALIRSHVADWIEESVHPENRALNAKIVAIVDKGVRIRIPGGERLISFQEIIAADKVILDCRVRGREPVWKDFKGPDPAISAKRIHNYSYAPPLAERIRRQIDVEQQLTEEGTFDPAGIKDARERILTAIVRRRGQPAFRTQLLVAYKGQCAITECAVDAVLEAAHIIPYMGAETNHPGNGLLLRADLHTLFDVGLVAVDVATMGVLISPKLAGTQYDEYRGKQIMVPDDPASQPSRDALEKHRQESGLCRNA